MNAAPLAEWLVAQGLAPSDMTPCNDGQVQQPTYKQAGPVNRRLFDLIRRAIREGHLKEGQKLPPTRQLAAELHLSRNTVLYAYERLEADGYTESRVGSGTYVSKTEAHTTAFRLAGAPTAPPLGRRPSSLAALSQRAQALLTRIALPSRHEAGPFLAGVPDVDEFPHAIWYRLMAKSWRAARSEFKGYGSSRGHPALTRALAEHLRLARGMRCDEEQLVITQGGHQGLDLCARLLADPGDCVWIEDPCSSYARSIFSAAGLRLQPVPVDLHGINPSRVLASDPTALPTLIFASPAHQFPRGVAMDQARRQLLIETAHRESAWIIEDDYGSEFRYDRLPLPCLQGQDAHGHTVYVGSFSRSLYPGLGIGFLVLPPQLVNPISQLRSELCPVGFMGQQAALAEFIYEGHYADYIRRMRRVYGRRRTLLVAELRRQLGDRIGIVGNDAGLHLTVELRDGNDVLASAAALARGIVAPPLSIHYHERATAAQGLVLGFGSVPDDQIVAAVSKLADAIESASQRMQA
nr:PLP-dependent aminotransferase family protein [uncultured Caldimonas sp.]